MFNSSSVLGDNTYKLGCIQLIIGHILLISTSLRIRDFHIWTELMLTLQSLLELILYLFLYSYLLRQTNNFLREFYEKKRAYLLLNFLMKSKTASPQLIGT